MSSEANNEAANASATEPSAAEPTPTTEASPAASARPTERAELPSIIVDPSASEADGPAPAADLPPDATVAAPAALAEQSGVAPESDDVWSPGALSEHDADRFADNLRPSWDIGGDATAGTWSAANAPLAQEPSFALGESTRSSSPDSIPPLVISRGLDRRIMIGGASIVLVIVLAIWSMSGGEQEAPPSWNKEAPPAAATPTSTSAAAIPSPTPDVQARAVPSATRPSATGAAPEQTKPVAVPAPIEPAATPTPAIPVAAKSIHLRISTSPTGADIKLDGDTVPNPFDAWVPRAGSHSVTVSAEGFVERTWNVNFDDDRTLALALKREAAKRPAPRAAVRVAPSSSKPAKAPTPRRETSPRSRPRGAGFVTDNPY